MPAMIWKIRHIVRLAYLFFYAVYALTPIHVYAMAGSSDGRRDQVPPRKHAATDIVWANVLFSPFGDDDTPSAVVGVAGGAQQGGDAVLIMKKRALFREQFDIKPQFDVKLLPSAGAELASFCSTEYKTAKAPLLRETGGCFVRNSGLSPPSSFLLS